MVGVPPDGRPTRRLHRLHLRRTLPDVLGGARLGLGPIVYAGSSAQLVAWRTAWGLPNSPVLPLAINEIAPGVEVRGPFVELEEEVFALHRQQAERYSGSLPESPPSR